MPDPLDHRERRPAKRRPTWVLLLALFGALLAAGFLASSDRLAGHRLPTSFLLR